jgi:hypothetical protein
MAGNLTPYKPPCTSTRRRPWWQRSYNWNLWATLGVGVLLWATFIAAWLFVQVLEAWT